MLIDWAAHPAALEQQGRDDRHPRTSPSTSCSRRPRWGLHSTLKAIFPVAASRRPVPRPVRERRPPQPGVVHRAPRALRRPAHRSPPSPSGPPTPSTPPASRSSTPRSCSRSRARPPSTRCTRATGASTGPTGTSGRRRARAAADLGQRRRRVPRGGPLRRLPARHPPALQRAPERRGRPPDHRADDPWTAGVAAVPDAHRAVEPRRRGRRGRPVRPRAAVVRPVAQGRGTRVLDTTTPLQVIEPGGGTYRAADYPVETANPSRSAPSFPGGGLSTATPAPLGRTRRRCCSPPSALLCALHGAVERRHHPESMCGSTEKIPAAPRGDRLHDRAPGSRPRGWPDRSASPSMRARRPPTRCG